MRKGCLIIAAMCGGFWCASAPAQSITQNISGSLYGSDYFSLFDPSLGTLVSVTITGTQQEGATLVRNPYELLPEESFTDTTAGSLEWLTVGTPAIISTTTLAGTEYWANGSTTTGVGLSGTIDAVLTGSELDSFIAASAGEQGSIGPLAGPFEPNVGSIYGTVGADFSATLSYNYLPGVVPEPATWAMMLLGFGAIAFAVRRSMNVTLS